MRRDETFTVGHHVSLDVELAAGSVLVRAAPLGAVLVSVDASNADSFEINQLGDSISVRQRRRTNARIAVDVPTGSDIAIRGAAIDVTTRGALGTMRLQTTSGDVDGDDFVRIDLTSVSGDARFQLVRESASFKTRSGSIDVKTIGGRLTASSVSGDVRTGLVSGDTELVTVSGEVRIERCGGSTVDARTVSGNITVGLPPGIRVEPDLSTMSGKVTLPDPAPTTTATGDRRAVRVRLRSVSGDIRIDRAI